MQKLKHQTYSFDEFTLDVTRGSLVRGVEEIKIRPKSFEVLKYLVENCGRLISKDELIQAVWTDTAVTDDSLVQCLKDIRHALDDKEQSFIKTVPRRGYIFEKEVSENGAIITYTEETSGVHLVIEEAEETNGHKAVETIEAARRSDEIAAPLKQTKVANLIGAIKQHKRATALALALFILFGGGLSYSLLVFLRQPPAPPFKSVTMKLLTTDGKAQAAAISPDGKYVAYVIKDEQESLWVRQVAAINPRQIAAPSEAGYGGLTFSPDGNFIYYVQNRTLYQLPTFGGVPRKIWQGLDSPITFSPDGKRLAFIRKGDGESRLMLANSDGSGESQVLTVRKQPDFFAWNVTNGCAWSPDGATIVCVGGEGGGFGQMYPIAVRVSDGRQSPLTSKRWNYTVQVAWLADGSGVLMNANDNFESTLQLWHISFPGGAAARIYNDSNSYTGVNLAANPDTLVTVREIEQLNIRAVNPFEEPRRVTQITSGAERGDGSLAITPDGRIVVASENGGSRDLWIMDADGSNQKQLTFDSLMETLQAVSPDGRSIVFVSNPGLWKIDIDGGNRRQLSGGGMFPAFSRDGNWIVYSSPSDRWTLWKMPSNGGDAIQLTNYPSVQPAVSPDGKLIAYMEVRPRLGIKKLMVIPFDGGEPLYTFDVPELQLPFNVEWTPDGKAITYNAVNNGVVQIVNRLLEGSPPQVLVESKTEKLGAFAWSRDGKRLFYTAGPVSSNVVMFTLSR